MLLKEFKGLDEGDILKLEILKHVPFTMWACDEYFKIVLWTCNSEKLYEYSEEEAIGENFIKLFVDGYEQHKAIEDTLDIINNNAKYSNIIASDYTKSKKPLELITNCFRIKDRINDRYLQAEVALDISNLGEKKKDLAKIREMGAKIEAIDSATKTQLIQLKAVLKERLGNIIDEKKRVCLENKKSDLEYEYKIYKVSTGKKREKEYNKKIEAINAKYAHLLSIIENRKLKLENKILKAKFEQLDEFELEFNSLTALDVSEMYNKEESK